MFAGVVVSGGEADGRLLGSIGAIGLSVKHVFEQIFDMSFVSCYRRTESRSCVSPLPKEEQKRSKEVRHGFFMS